jgi:hypothetical protein
MDCNYSVLENFSTIGTLLEKTIDSVPREAYNSLNALMLALTQITVTINNAYICEFLAYRYPDNLKIIIIKEKILSSLYCNHKENVRKYTVVLCKKFIFNIIA